MAIIKRASERSEGFVIIDRRAIQDSRLTWAARGLLSYLLSLPAGWEVVVIHLKKQSPGGRDVVYRLLRELIEHKYILRRQSRNKNGSISGTEYLVYEMPYTDSQDMDSPSTVGPDPANPPLQTKQDNKENKTTTHSSIGAVPSCVMLNYPKSIPESERAPLLEILQALSASKRQQVLDEVAAYIVAGDLRGSPCALARGLVRAVTEGRFRPNKSRILRRQQKTRQQSKVREKDSRLSQLDAEIKALEQMISAAPDAQGALEKQCRALKQQYKTLAEGAASHANAS